jgi:hypothetical protein
VLHLQEAYGAHRLDPQNMDQRRVDQVVIHHPERTGRRARLAMVTPSRACRHQCHEHGVAHNVPLDTTADMAQKSVEYHDSRGTAHEFRRGHLQYQPIQYDGGNRQNFFWAHLSK